MLDCAFRFYQTGQKRTTSTQHFPFLFLFSLFSLGYKTLFTQSNTWKRNQVMAHTFAAFQPDFCATFLR